MHEQFIKEIARRYRVRDIQGWKDDQIFLTIDKLDAVDFITYLKQVEGFTHLSFFTALDKIEEGMFYLKYMLHSYQRNLDFCVSVPIEREPADSEKATMDSISHLWVAAITYEQELAEMFGIDFPGSPRVGKSFLLEGWHDKPPMRRDFDTKKFSEETYFERPGRETHDPAEHMRKELYPSEAEKW